MGGHFGWYRECERDPLRAFTTLFRFSLTKHALLRQCTSSLRWILCTRVAGEMDRRTPHLFSLHFLLVLGSAVGAARLDATNRLDD